MANNRNDESRANISLQSDHAGCKSMSPRPAGIIYHPPTVIPHFYWRRFLVDCQTQAAYAAAKASITAGLLEPSKGLRRVGLEVGSRSLAREENRHPMDRGRPRVCGRVHPPEEIPRQRPSLFVVVRHF